MAKAEPNIAEAEPVGTVSKTIDFEHALAFLRSENAKLRSENTWLKDRAEANAKIAAQNEGIRKQNSEHVLREKLKLQQELLASQERVCELQNKLLSLRQIVNSA